MSRVVVTGGARFIGSHVVDAFTGRDHEVLALDDLSNGARANVPSGADLAVVDIRATELIPGLVETSDWYARIQSASS